MYSLTWAETVINRALNKHARAANYFLTSVGLCPRQLAKLLADGRPEWPILRDMLKQLDIWETRQVAVLQGPSVLSTTSLFSDLVRRNHARMPEGLRLYLDNRVKSLKLEEQGNRGGAPQGAPLPFQEGSRASSYGP
jgi:hypothetical protein